MAHLYKFLDELDIDQEAKRKLSQILQRVEEGNDQVYRTPFCKDEAPEVVLSKWDKVFQDHSTKLEAELLDVELHNREKFGPRSIAKPWSERKEDVLYYFKPGQDREETREDTVKLGRGSEAVAKNILRPVDINTASKSLKGSTSSGLPYMLDKALVRERAVRDFDELASQKYPCVPFTRTQEQGKTRLVWGYPIGDTIFEMRYFLPLLKYQRKLSWRNALVGPLQVDKRATQLFAKLGDSGSSIVSIDFKSYDASIKEDLQMAARSYVTNLFQREYSHEIELIFDRLGTIGLVTPDGIWEGKHGVPSGSAFTNEVDSIVQHSLTLNYRDKDIQGDDAIYVVDDPDQLLLRFTDAGLEVNEDKSHVSQNYAVYLQKYYSRGYKSYYNSSHLGGVYPVYRALNRLIFQERWSNFEEFEISGQDYYSIRAHQILTDVVNHPYFFDLVKFAVSNDRFGLEFSGQGVRKYVKMLNDSSGSQGLITNQYGAEVKGINNFASVKAMRAL